MRDIQCLLTYIATNIDKNISERISIKSLNCEEDVTVLSLVQPSEINLSWGPIMFWDFLNIIIIYS